MVSGQSLPFSAYDTGFLFNVPPKNILRFVVSRSIVVIFSIWSGFSRAISHMFMMTSSNGNIFRVTGHLRGELTGHRWVPHTMASDLDLWRFSLIFASISGWVNNGEAGDLRRQCAHYDVTVMLREVSVAPQQSYGGCNTTEWMVISLDIVGRYVNITKRKPCTYYPGYTLYQQTDGSLQRVLYYG